MDNTWDLDFLDLPERLEAWGVRTVTLATEYILKPRAGTEAENSRSHRDVLP